MCAQSCEKLVGGRFVVQHYGERHAHFELRLELAGSIQCWSVIDGPGGTPGDRRLAVWTGEVGIAALEGVETSRGQLVSWDRGLWVPLNDPHRGLKGGVLKFTVSGQRLNGSYALVRLGKPIDRRENWLLIKQSGREWRSAEDERRMADRAVVRRGRRVERELLPDKLDRA